MREAMPRAIRIPTGIDTHLYLLTFAFHANFYHGMTLFAAHHALAATAQGTSPHPVARPYSSAARPTVRATTTFARNVGWPAQQWTNQSASVAPFAADLMCSSGIASVYPDTGFPCPFAMISKPRRRR